MTSSGGVDPSRVRERPIEVLHVKPARSCTVARGDTVGARAARGLKEGSEGAIQRALKRFR